MKNTVVSALIAGICGAVISIAVSGYRDATKNRYVYRVEYDDYWEDDHTCVGLFYSEQKAKNEVEDLLDGLDESDKDREREKFSIIKTKIK